MDGHRSRILSIKYHPLESNIFLSGGWDDTVQIWDQRDSRSLRYEGILSPIPLSLESLTTMKLPKWRQITL